jgi:hypothetical protein
MLMKAQILMILMLLMLLLLMMMMLLFYHARPGKTVWASEYRKSRAVFLNATTKRKLGRVGRHKGRQYRLRLEERDRLIPPAYPEIGNIGFEWNSRGACAWEDRLGDCRVPQNPQELQCY